MDKLSYHRQIVQQILSRHAELAPEQGQIESTPIFDERNDHYLLVDLGWDRTGRNYSVATHIRLKNGKIWIERDGTPKTASLKNLFRLVCPKRTLKFSDPPPGIPTVLPISGFR
jgi:hypothetical protein